MDTIAGTERDRANAVRSAGNGRYARLAARWPGRFPAEGLPPVLQNLPLPIIGSPLFIISNPKLVIEQCKAGVVGSMPALNARPAEQLDEWLAEITETLAAYNKANPDKPAAPFARALDTLKASSRPVRTATLHRDLEPAMSRPVSKRSSVAMLRSKTCGCSSRMARCASAAEAPSATTRKAGLRASA